MRKRRYLGAAVSVLALLAAGVAPSSALAEPPAAPAHSADTYEVLGTTSPQLRTAAARTGADVLSATDESTTVVATPEQVARLRNLGFTVEPRSSANRSVAEVAPEAVTDFPAGDEAYHTYGETTAELRQTVASFPSLAELSSVGQSYEGRDLNMIKISGKVSTDAKKPAVLFTCNQHAREHLTTEMCLHIVQRLTSGYATDPAIQKMVDDHEIFVIPNVNPDGSEYDISGGHYHSWRKNRQPAATDPNRNWDYHWGCCGGSSGDVSNETYRGPAAFSAPETKAVSDWVNSRKVGGVQQIKTHIDFHTYSELILWPFGYTYDATGPDMTAAEAQRFSSLGRQMAATNGYTAEQGSSLYVTDGDMNDWMWGTQKVLSFAFEMYPKGDNPGFYPPGSAIAAETARDDKAVDLIINAAV